MARLTKKQIRQREDAVKLILILAALGTYLLTDSMGATIVIVAFVAIFMIGWTIFKSIQEREKLRKSGISVIDRMDGIRFEHYLRELYASQGFKVQVTKSSNDFGADLILKTSEKKIVVQAKRYSKNVGIKAVQEINGAKSYYQAQEGWVVTNSYFTKAAKELAHSLNIKLIDRDSLIDDIVKLKQKAI